VASGEGSPLIGCLPVQPHGLAIVLLRRFTLAVHEADVVLGVGVPPIAQLFGPPAAAPSAHGALVLSCSKTTPQQPRTA
jgi:hypothetical protein